MRIIFLFFSLWVSRNIGDKRDTSQCRPCTIGNPTLRIFCAASALFPGASDKFQMKSIGILYQVIAHQP